MSAKMIQFKNLHYFLIYFLISTRIDKTDSIENQSHQNILGRYSFPKKISEPIDIKSQDAKNGTLLPLRFFSILRQRTKLINNGKSVEVIPVDQQKHLTQLTGGTLFPDTYTFHKLRYYWIDNTTKTAITTMDGMNGAPLLIEAIHYNLKYGSYENALKFPNGLLVVLLPVPIGEHLNLQFALFECKFKSILQPTSETEIAFGQSYLWFDNYPLSTRYSTYLRSYIDDKTGKEYPCTTTLVFPKGKPISKVQFESTFGSLKGPNGKPLTNTVPQKPSKMNVIQSRGLIQKLIP